MLRVDRPYGGTGTMRSTVAIVSLEALRWNLSLIKRKAQGAGICAMVKANAYGHGMVRCAQALQDEGVAFLGVAFVEEGILLRKAGITCPILVLTPNEPHQAQHVATHNLTMVICSIEQARGLNEVAARGNAIQGHLYVDTGMHRDGFLASDIADALLEFAEMPGLHLTGICTHLATTDVASDPFITEQLELFARVLWQCELSGFSFAHIHAANTGAIWQSQSACFTLVRPGLSLYGYANPADELMQLRPVLSIRSAVLSIRHLWPGETVSYGRRFMTPRQTTIVTVPIGYGDGYMRALSGKASCLIGGKQYPVVGTVCMDEVMVDVGDDAVAVGDEVVLLGIQSAGNGEVNSIDAIDLASWANTIPYEITTAISERVRREYV